VREEWGGGWGGKGVGEKKRVGRGENKEAFLSPFGLGFLLLQSQY